MNLVAYVELLITVVKLWITRVANGRSFVWQQDSDPATPLKKCKRLLANCCYYISPNVWPLNSLDPNPMDYYVLGAVGKDANRRDSTTKAQLIDKIKAVFLDPSQ